MRVLAFDCAGAQCAAAILANDEVVAMDRVESERGHAQILMPLLVELAHRAGIAFRDLDRLAVTTGPGSFTGIRVALAAAHGLALGIGKPITGVTVFETIAAQAAETGFPTDRLLVAIESRRTECFVQLFASDGAPIGKPSMQAPEAISAWVGAGSMALAGDAADRVLPYLPGAIAMEIRQVDPVKLAKLAARRAAGPAPAPFYIRPPDANPSARRARP